VTSQTHYARAAAARAVHPTHHLGLVQVQVLAMAMALVQVEVQAQAVALALGAAVVTVSSAATRNTALFLCIVCTRRAPMRGHVHLTSSIFSSPERRQSVLILTVSATLSLPTLNCQWNDSWRTTAAAFSRTQFSLASFDTISDASRRAIHLLIYFGNEKNKQKETTTDRLATLLGLADQLSCL